MNLPLCARRRNCRYVVFAKSASCMRNLCTNLSTLELMVPEKICSLLIKCRRGNISSKLVDWYLYTYTREASGEAFRREKRELSGLLPSSALNCACEHFFSHAFRLTSNKTRMAARGLQTFVQIKNINRHVSTLKPYSLYFYPVQFSVPSLSFSSLF